MKQNTAENKTALVVEPDTLAKAAATPARDREFAKELRALGQEIEKFSFSAFDLQIDSGIYVVTGRASMRAQNVKFSFSRFVRELLQGSSPTPTMTTKPGQIDLRFSPDEIEKFDVRGRVKREDPGKMPDPYSISQILRGAGSYLDNRDVTSLVGISLKDRWVTVRYQTAEGRLEQAKQDLEYFYDYWVKMYMRRSNRTKLAPPSDPTFRVNWESIQKAHRLPDAPS